MDRRQALKLGMGSAAALALTACKTGKDGGSGAAPAKDAKVGLICLHDENSPYDRNFLDAFNKAVEQLGLNPDSCLVKTNIPEGQECYDAAAELADAGCVAVVADSNGHEDYILQAASEFPEVHFCSATGTKAHTSGLDNFHNAFASIYEGRYLTGVAAGMKLKELADAGKLKGAAPKIGYVGAYPYAEVISGYTSFYLGVKSVMPDVTMDVTYTGTWYDEAAEKEAANKLMEDGADLISQHADSMGAPTACENAGVVDVAYNGSIIDACPKTSLISAAINWEPYFAYFFKAAQEGSTIDADWTGSLKDGSVVLTELNKDIAAAGTAEKLEEIKAKLEDGSLHVFDTTTFTVNGKQLDSYQADVDDDAEHKGDTEVVADGYFHESEKRSAPYFDLKIDGINLVESKQ